MDLDLKLIGDECLTKKANTVSDINSEIHHIIPLMKKKMVELNGIGLAAPQVGVDLRIMGYSLRDWSDSRTNKSTHKLDFRRACKNARGVFEHSW